MIVTVIIQRHFILTFLFSSLYVLDVLNYFEVQFNEFFFLSFEFIVHIFFILRKQTACAV